MSLNLFRAHASDINSSYRTNMETIFNALSGLETQTYALGGLTITPETNSTATFRVTNSSGTVLLNVDTINNVVNMIGSISLSTSDIEITNSSFGLILKSPNGTRFRIQIGDDGALSTTSL